MHSAQTFYIFKIYFHIILLSTSRTKQGGSSRINSHLNFVWILANHQLSWQDVCGFPWMLQATVRGHNNSFLSNSFFFIIQPPDAKESVSMTVSLSELHRAEPFLRNHQLCSYSRTFWHFMEHEGSLPGSQGPSTGPHPQPDQSSTYHPILAKNHFNIIHPLSMSRSS
jgi:hypothetical protein